MLGRALHGTQKVMKRDDIRYEGCVGDEWMSE